MVNQELLTYIKSELQRGVSQDEIQKALRASNWQEQDITDSLQAAMGGGTQAMSGLPTPPITNLPGIGDLLKTSWGIFKKRAGSFTPIIILPQLGFLVIGIIAFLGGLAQSAPGTTKYVLNIIIGLMGLIAVVLVILVQPLAQVGLIYAIREHERPVSLKEAYQQGWRKLGAFWWISILTGLIVLTGILLFVIPGIIFGVWFSFGLFILVDEDIRGMNALLKSKEYVRGLWGKVFVRYILVAILVVIISGIVAGIGGAVAGKNSELINSILNFVLQLFILPFMMTYYYELYRNVKAMKPGMAFTPNPSHRTLFGIFAAIGPIIVILLVIVGFSLAGAFLYKTFGSLKNMPQYQQPATNQQDQLPPGYQLPNTLQQNQNSSGSQAPAEL